jgi:hypothetical protein
LLVIEIRFNDGQPVIQTNETNAEYAVDYRQVLVPNPRAHHKSAPAHLVRTTFVETFQSFFMEPVRFNNISIVSSHNSREQY